MSNAQPTETNKFLAQPLGMLFLTTALPIIMIMLVNGLYSLVDAYFLGVFVGAAALTAVTMMFPVQMLIISLSTMISNGFASIVARRLGAGEHEAAGHSFVIALALGIGLSFLMMLFFVLFGAQLINWVTSGDEELSRMAWTYMSISMFTSPLMFINSILYDALRSEGKMAFMSITALTVTLLNMAFNYLFIVQFDMGVAGSAWGTVAAQMVSFFAILIYRMRGGSNIPFAVPNRIEFIKVAKENLALGAPLSLNYLSISLIAGSVVAMLKIVSATDYNASVGAYGIITRLLTFAYMPLLGLSMAFQSIVGNNYGGKLSDRVNFSTKTALIIGFVYCAILQVVMMAFPSQLADVFVDDPVMIAETARVLPIIMIFYFTAGPSVILTGFFQAIGDAKRAAILSLSRNYLIGLPLIWTVPHMIGEEGIWWVSPIGDALMVFLIIGVLLVAQKRKGYRKGIFLPQTV